MQTNTLISMRSQESSGQPRPDENLISDQVLLERIASGDRRAMEMLFLRHRVRIYRFALRLMNNPANAEDLTSDVFLELWKKAPRFEGRAEVSTYLLAIARHKAMSALRRRTTEQLDDATASAIPDSADNAETILLKQGQSAIVQECLAQLSAAHREIVDLAYYHGKSIAEIAEITGVPQNTVKTRMFHARKRLAVLLGAHGLDAAA